MNNITWIIVADATRARIFTHLDNSVATQPHADKLLHLHHELGSHDSHDSTYVNTSDPKEGEAASFAQNLASYLEKNRTDHQYTDLVLVAPPHFLGLLNQHISKEVEKLITKSIAKDYTAEDLKFLSKHLQEAIS
jgi:protein required for attachment to host cells